MARIEIQNDPRDSIHLRADVHDFLKKRADQLGITVSEYVESILDLYCMEKVREGCENMLRETM